MEEDKYYVYVYLDPRKKGEFIYGDYEFNNEPFYVGKGKDSRYKRHIRKSEFNKNNNYKNNKIRNIVKYGLIPIIIKVCENISEKKAHELEEKMIIKIGRYDLGLGPLANFTNGGEGNSGFVMSEETKEKLRNINLDKPSLLKGKTYDEIYGVEGAKNKINKLKIINSGKTYDEIYGVEKSRIIKEKIKNGNIGKIYNSETRQKISDLKLGLKHSEETKIKISKSLIGNTRRKGCKHSEETKRKISDTKKGILSWNATAILQLTKNDVIVREWVSATAASKELKLSQGNIWSVINGRRKTCGGFKWKLK